MSREDDETSEAMRDFWKSVNKSVKYMKGLLESDTPSNKLRVIIILLFAGILGSSLLWYFHKDSGYNFISVIILGIFMGGFGLILGKPYIKILDFFIKLGSDEINALRWVTTILLIDLPIAIAAAIFMDYNLIKISLWVLVGQIPIIFIGSIKQLNIWNAPKTINSESKMSLWDILGKINIVLGIIGSVITIILLFIK